MKCPHRYHDEKYGKIAVFQAVDKVLSAAFYIIEHLQIERKI